MRGEAERVSSISWEIKKRGEEEGEGEGGVKGREGKERGKGIWGMCVCVCVCVCECVHLYFELFQHLSSILFLPVGRGLQLLHSL